MGGGGGGDAQANGAATWRGCPAKFVDLGSARCGAGGRGASRHWRGPAAKGPSGIATQGMGAWCACARGREVVIKGVFVITERIWIAAAEGASGIASG